MSENKINRFGEQVLEGDGMIHVGDPRKRPGIPINTHDRLQPKPNAKPVWFLFGVLVIGLILTGLFYPGPHF